MLRFSKKYDTIIKGKFLKPTTVGGKDNKYVGISKGYA